MTPAGDEPIKSRKIPPNRISVTGRYVSRSGKVIPYESGLERDFYLLSDFEVSVKEITPQPKLAIDGHVPDALLKTGSETIVVDVKPESELVKNWSKHLAAFLRTAKYCEEHRYGYEFFTDAVRSELKCRIAVLKEVHHYGRQEADPRAKSAILQALEKGPLKVAPLFDILNTYEPSQKKAALADWHSNFRSESSRRPRPSLTTQ